MEAVPVKIVPRDFGETRRRDWWWVEPMIVFAVFGSVVVYATWAAFQNAHYTYGPYLSPFYSPVIWGDSHHAWFGPKPDWWPALAPFSPALLILPFFASPATTTAGRTTKRSGWTRCRAQSVSRERPTGANAGFR